MGCHSTWPHSGIRAKYGKVSEGQLVGTRSGSGAMTISWNSVERKSSEWDNQYWLGAEWRVYQENMVEIGENIL